LNQVEFRVVSRIALAHDGILRLELDSLVGDHKGPERVIASLPSLTCQVDCTPNVPGVVGHRSPTRLGVVRLGFSRGGHVILPAAEEYQRVAKARASTFFSCP
jgi:hypothetical protein